MKARSASVIANDGQVAVEITITLTPRKGYTLEVSELQHMTKVAARVVAGTLTELPYSDFGAENIKVKL